MHPPSESSAALATLLGAALLFYAPLMAAGISPNPDWAEPMMAALADRRCLLDFGLAPVWIPWLDGGMPQLGHPHDLSAGPLLWLVLILGSVAGVKASAVAFAVAGAVGLSLLAARALGLSPGGALVAGGLFAVGAALPAELRSGSLPKLALALLPWALYGYHLGGRRGWTLAAAAAALIVSHAGLSSLVAIAAAAAWIGLDRIGGGFSGRGAAPARPRHIALGLLVGAALIAGKLAGIHLLLTGPTLTPSKDAADAAAWLAMAGPVEPATVLRSLLAAPAAAADPLWPADHRVFYLGWAGLAGLAAAPFLVALERGRGWRVLLLAAAALAVGSAAGLRWGPWRWMVELLPPMRSVYKVDKYLVVPLAAALSLTAAWGLDGLWRRLGAAVSPRFGSAALPWAGLALGALVCAEPWLVNRALIQGQFPLVGPPRTALPGAAPASVAVDLQGAALERWQDVASVYRLGLLIDGWTLIGQKEFQREAQPTPRYLLRVPGLGDWRSLAGGPPPARLVETPGWTGESSAGALREDPGAIYLSGLSGAAAATLNRRFDPRWRALEPGVQVSEADGLLRVEPGGAEAVTLVYRAPLARLAWGLSQLAWLGVGGWLVLAPRRRR